MQAAFQQAALPEPFTVLGKKLKPYTLGHDILLGVFESGFCRDVKAVPSWEDLLISVWVCSMDAETVWEQLQNPELEKTLKAWSDQCGLFDVSDAYIAFSNYINAHTETPAYWVDDRGASSSSSDIPFSQFLKVQLMREFGMKEHEALSTTYAQACINYLIIQEGNGRIRFMSEGDKAAIRAASDPELDKKLQALAQRMAHN